jgi:6-phosphogluconate dehydrogenase
MLLRAAATEFGWKLKYGEIALMWRGGCIIRSQFLGKIKEAFESVNAYRIYFSILISSEKFESAKEVGVT